VGRHDTTSATYDPSTEPCPKAEAPPLAVGERIVSVSTSLTSYQVASWGDLGRDEVPHYEPRIAVVWTWTIATRPSRPYVPSQGWSTP